AATFCLMYAFPLLLLIQGDFPFSEVARPAAFALTCWGGALYLWAGALYFGQVVAAVRRARTAPRGELFSSCGDAARGGAPVVRTLTALGGDRTGTAQQAADTE